MTHPAGPDAEAVFVRAAAQGDAAAWRSLLEGNSERVARYVRWRCTGLPDLAADAIQQTWLEAVKSLGRFDPARGSFSDWVGGIVRRVVPAELRKRRRDRRHQRSLSGLPEPSTPSARSTEEAEAVARALAELTEEHEAVLRAKYLEAQSVLTIAEATGLTPKAVESRLTRARESFRQAYLRQQGDEA